MFKTVLLLVLCCHTLSQPISVHTRERRQLGECCPCPQDVDALAASARRAGLGVDDCPCRPRSADSEGAASILFPTALGAGGPFLRPPESKEDSKNLLEPEVSLATSVLDTLREVTEEEYQNALARDAARSAIESTDVIPEESARNMVIVVHPRDSGNNDDSNPEATHVPETRCIHPLGSSFGSLRSSQPNDDLSEPTMFSKIRVPNLHRNNLIGRDSSLGASNIEESIVNINGNSPNIVPYNPLTGTRNLFNSLRNNELFNGVPRVPLNDEIGVVEKAVFPHIPKLKLDDILRKPFSDSKYQDSNINFNNQVGPLSYGDSQASEKLLPPHLNLRNLMKLRDVELFPKQNHQLFNKFAIPSVLKKIENDLTLKENNYADLSKGYEFGTIEGNKKSTNLNFDEDVSENADIKQKSSQVDKEYLNMKPILVENQQMKVINNDKTAEQDMENMAKIKKMSSAKNALANGFEERFLNDEVSLKSESYIQQDLDAAGSSDNITPVLQEIEDEVMKPLPENYETTNNESENTCEQENFTPHSAQNAQQEDKLMAASQDDNTASSIKELKNTLTTLRENFARELEKIKKSSVTTDYRAKDDTGKINRLDNQFLKHKESIEMKNYIDSVGSPDLSGAEKQNENDISIADLQDMANKLLSPTFKKESDENSVKNLVSEKSTHNSGNFDDHLKSRTNLANLTPTNREAEEEQNIMYPDNLQRTILIDNNEKEATEDITNKEMDTGASDIVMSTSPEIIEPSNSDSHLGMPLPLEQSAEFLNELNDVKISQVNVRIVEPSGVSKENNCVYDDDKMMPAASIANPQRKLSSSQPLNDFDIFKNKLSTPDSLLKKSNLNSYRAKIQIPSKLELKPPHSGTKSKDNNKEFNILSRKSKPSLLLQDNKLDTFPQLNGLSNKLRSNTNNLLNKRIHPDLNLLSGNEDLNRFEDVTHNFRQNAQKAIEDLQEKLKLRKTKTSSALGESYAKPQELLEDVNDKLKAIHYDLNDRLNSIRDEILDSPRLILDNSHGHLVDRHSKNNLRTNNARTTPARLRSSATSISPQEVELPGPIDKSLRQNLLKASAPEIHNTNIIKEKPKIASSHMTPLQRIPSPLRQAPTVPIATRQKPQSAFTTFLERSSSFENFDIPTIKKIPAPVHNRVKPKKVTISFGSTTVPPFLTGRSSDPTISMELGENQWKENKGILSLKEKVSGLGERLRSAHDAQVSPSELNIFRSPYSLKSALEGRDNNLNAQNNVCHPKSLDADSREVNSNDGFSDNNSRKKFNWPKVTENSFLSKVRDSFSSLLSENSQKKDDESVESRPDMLRSESRDSVTIGEEPLKENVSYRCRMVCTKEYR